MSDTIVVKKAAPFEEFQDLMLQTDIFLNKQAKKKADYFKLRGGTKLETDVFDAMVKCARKTSFAQCIELVSGASFPDIVAKIFENDYYGVEVKSTISDRWTSTGSSILESTRDPKVKKIYLTFGKLGGNPIEFLSRPYEECMESIAVTHYPRYKINMQLKSGDTIFDKMHIPYDDLRQMENPVTPVAEYYKSQLSDGESLWWTGDTDRDVVPPTIRIWSVVSQEERVDAIVHGLAYFPEIVSGKYNQFVLWLVTNRGIVNPNVRDGFSAGGQVRAPMSEEDVKLPPVFGRIDTYREAIVWTINTTDVALLKDYWKVDAIENNRIAQWCELILLHLHGSINFNTIKKLLIEKFL